MSTAGWEVPGVSSHAAKRMTANTRPKKINAAQPQCPVWTAHRMRIKTTMAEIIPGADSLFEGIGVSLKITHAIGGEQHHSRPVQGQHTRTHAREESARRRHLAAMAQLSFEFKAPDCGGQTERAGGLLRRFWQRACGQCGNYAATARRARENSGLHIRCVYHSPHRR